MNIEIDELAKEIYCMAIANDLKNFDREKAKWLSNTAYEAAKIFIDIRNRRNEYSK